MTRKLHTAAPILVLLLLNASELDALASPGRIFRTQRPSSGRIVRSKAENETEGEEDSNERKPGNKGLRKLAQLSLEDYAWRRGVFKTEEASRRVEESLARMMGEEASYFRPMDANDEKRGPLGQLEKAWVEWLGDVFDEEARRAEKIVSSEGSLVRPKDAATPEGDLGPLGMIEKQFVDFLNMIKSAEKERASSKTLRPMDMEESKRGPLGEAELKAVTAIREVFESEKLRMEQSRRRGGAIVRPIDIPGPIGDFEMAVIDVIRAEQQRKLEGEKLGEKRFVRPIDSSAKSVLSSLEQSAVDAVARLTNEEKERLRNIQRLLDENRPMDKDRMSFLGVLEAIVVGILRAPVVISSVVTRVSELMKSEALDDGDTALVDKDKIQSRDKSSRRE